MNTDSTKNQYAISISISLLRSYFLAYASILNFNLKSAQFSSWGGAFLKCGLSTSKPAKLQKADAKECIFDYLIGQKNVGLIFRRTKLFVRQNLRHFQKISSLLSDAKFCPKFVFVTHYVYKCISTFGKMFRRTKIFVGLNYSSDIIFVTFKKFRHFFPTFFFCPIRYYFCTKR